MDEFNRGREARLQIKLRATARFDGMAGTRPQTTAVHRTHHAPSARTTHPAHTRNSTISQRTQHITACARSTPPAAAARLRRTHGRA